MPLITAAHTSAGSGHQHRGRAPTSLRPRHPAPREHSTQLGHGVPAYRFAITINDPQRERRTSALQPPADLPVRDPEDLSGLGPTSTVQQWLAESPLGPSSPAPRRRRDTPVSPCWVPPVSSRPNSVLSPPPKADRSCATRGGHLTCYQHGSKKILTRWSALG